MRTRVLSGFLTRLTDGIGSGCPAERFAGPPGRLHLLIEVGPWCVDMLNWFLADAEPLASRSRAAGFPSTDYYPNVPMLEV